MIRVTLLTFALCAAAFAASAQDLVSGLSQDQVEITSSYAGTSIVVFGAIEAGDNAPKDVVVVVRGPDTALTVRRKVRMAGLWINRDLAKLAAMPSYYFLASSRPLARIASLQTLQRYQLGLAQLSSLGSGPNIEPFRIAAIAAQARDGLYTETRDVEFLSYTLFRVRVPIPATVPRGEYTVEAYLFRDGTVASAQSTPLFVDQTGIERRLYRFAHAWPFVYGLSTVVLAMALGWLSSLLIRQQR